MKKHGQRRLACRRAIATVLAVLLAPIVVVSSQDVAVASIPATQWPPATLFDMPRPANMWTLPDGGVAVGCSVTGIDAIKSFDADGHVGQTIIGSSAALPDMCATDSTVSKDGTVYAYTSLNNYTGQAIKAYHGGVEVWSYELPCGATGVQAMAMGGDGNIYVVITGGSGSCGSTFLVGLTPGHGFPAHIPNVVLGPLTITGLVEPGGLAAYDGGLVIRGNNNLQFVYAGSIHATSGLNLAGFYGPQLQVVWASGKTFVPVKASSGAQSTCGDTAIASGIDAHSPSGYLWRYSLPDCSEVYEIRPTPSGGFVVHTLAPQENIGDPLANYLTAVDPNGNVLWRSQVALDIDTHYQALPFAVDMNGNVAVQRDVMLIGNSAWFPAVRFQLFSGLTGNELYRLELSGGNLSTNDGPSYLWTDAGYPQIHIARNTLYVAARTCTTSTDCSTSSSTLYALKVPGLQMDYPRGEVLATSHTPLDYVAMGDSFSSGEGVPGFIAPSDSNGCHRSSQAYSKLLDGTPSLRWQLTAFVACSGATTGDVINGKNGESSQLDALSASTRVVTITIGGNDVGFKQFANKCVGWPQFDPLSVCDAGSAEYQVAIEKIDNLLPGSLTRTTLNDEGVLRRIRAKAPNAQVYVIGYPQLAPPSTEPHQWPWCSWLNSATEHAAAREVVSRLNLRLSQAVTTMGAGFTFLDPNQAGSPFLGHELCDGATYFNGPQLPPEYSLHPNASGQDAYRQLVVAAM